MLEILTEPNPILRIRTKPVRSDDSSVGDLVNDMRLAMKKAKGIGLAAPQVGIDKQIAIVEIPEERLEDGRIEVASVPLTILINPKIAESSRTQSTAYEGCLSLPKIQVNVTRPTKITVTFDQNNSRHSLKADGLFARAIQHEIDHLNGILITDHGKAEPIDD